MHIDSRSVVAALAFAVATAVPATAEANPTLTTDRACYAADVDSIRFNGGGFTPGAPISLFFAHNGKIGSFDTAAGPEGTFQAGVRAPTLEQFDADPPRFQLDVTANDQSLMGPEGPIGPPELGFAFAQVTISEWQIRVAEWDAAPGSPTAVPGRRVTVRTTGWAGLGRTLYVHYLRGTKAVHSAKVGPLTGPCGDFTRKIRTFAFKAARPGTYAVRFSTSPRWNRKDAWLGYRTVRLRG